MKTADKKQLQVPAVALAIGTIYLVVGLIGDQRVFAFSGFGIMVGFGLVLWLLRGRSETVKGLLDHRDERINAMDLMATAVAGAITLTVTLVAFVVDIARGNDGMPYAWLAAAGGVSYAGSLVVQRIRS